MPPGPPLSDEEEAQDRADRDEVHRLETKLRELRPRRQALVNDVRRISEEQRELAQARAPRQDSLEEVHSDHQQLGRQLSALRKERDAARRRVEDALIRLREFRALAPRSERAHPEQIRREIADLEMRQQTHALKIQEENALIDRVRELTRSLALAEKEKTATETRHQQLTTLETDLVAARKEVDRLGGELARVHTERDRKMQSLREKLLEEGRLVAELREKARLRSETLDRLELLNREVVGMERKVDDLLARVRGRRHEARQNIRDYNRSVREAVAGPDAYARAADAQLQELLKRGRVTLSG